MFLIALIRSILRIILRLGKPNAAVLNIFINTETFFSLLFFSSEYFYEDERYCVVRVSAGPGEGGNPGGDQGQVQGAHQALASGQGQPIILQTPNY
jgi:hypothetical protein